jgi:hypothetical protein
MTSEERFSTALRDLDDIVASVGAESLWRYPFDRLRAAMYSDEVARMRAAFSRGDAAVRANLARAAERLANEARQAFTIVMDTPAPPSAAAAAPARQPPVESGSIFPPIIAGGLVAVGVVSGAMILSAAIRAIGGGVNYEEYDEQRV